jgi:hypothetical protein
MFSMREFLVFVVGMVLATLLTVLGRFTFSRITFCCSPAITLSNRAGSSRRKRSSGNRKAAQSGRPISAAIGRAFIEPFAATDSGPSFPRRWSLPVQLSESEQY